MLAIYRLWQHMPFVGRLLLMASMALILSGGAMLYTAAQRDAHDTRTDLQALLQDELDSLPQAVAESLVIGDFASLQQILNQHVQQYTIKQLIFHDNANVQVQAYNQHMQPVQPVPQWFVNWLGLSDLSGLRVVVVGGRSYGTLEVVVSAQTARERSWERTRSYVFILLLAIGLDSFGIWLMLRAGLRPLKILVESSRALASGNVAVRIPPSGAPELRQALVAFNQMADAIQRTQQQLELEKEQLRVTLTSIGDAVLVTDVHGRITLMNAEAERLSGWTEAQALHQSLDEVLPLINETTLLAQPNPVQTAIREQRLVELANHTLLISRDGHKWPIADSAAPIRNEHNKVIGAVMVFRDQTREHQHLTELRASTARLSAVIQGFPGALLMEDEQRQVILANRAFCQMFGLGDDPAHLIGTDGRVSTQPGIELFSDPREFRRKLEILLKEHKIVLQEIYSLRDGRILERDYIPIVDQNHFMGHLRIYRDVTEHYHTQAQMRLAASVFASAHEGIVITDRRGDIIEINQSFTRITGYKRQELLGKNPRLFQSGQHNRDFYQQIWNCVYKQGYWSGEIWDKRKDGQLYPAMLTISAVLDEQAHISHYVGISTDISLLKQHEQQLEHIAHYDALTGVPNRVLLGDRMQRAITQAHRSKKLLGVVYLDLDGFKVINDSLGHEAGDRLLIEIARRLKEGVRGCDTLARLGGDEFVLLLQELDRVEECLAILEHILTLVAAPLHLPTRTVSISASIGVSIYPIDDADPDTLLRHADQAMYLAKQSGKNRYHLFDPEHDRRVKSYREALERLTLALTQHEFELYYQPKVNMRTGLVTGAEALLRWNHPERGLLTPAEFLPLLGNTDLEIRLGWWVIEQALAQLALWETLGLELVISVNVAASHLQQKRFIDDLQHRLAGYPQVPAHWLQLEILESAALEDMNTVAELIDACHKLGVTFALDDFGTGYSSLAYLKRLPAATLKIDQSFVRDMLKDPEDLAIVQGVIALTKAFKRTVIAEGVESAEHGLLLLQLGCEYAQGYGVARPMPAQVLPQWVSEWQPDPLWQSAQVRWPEQDFALFLATLNHREWMSSLLKHLQSDTPQQLYEDIADPKGCHFGQWYYGAGQSRYGQWAVFQQVAPIHQHVHQLGNELLQLVELQQHAQVQQRIPELLSLHAQLLECLQALQAEVLQHDAKLTATKVAGLTQS